MNILSIETSCDETAVCIVRAEGLFPNASYTILGNSLFSQIDLHREYGGVFPSVAKREHARTLLPMLTRALDDAALPCTSIALTAEQTAEIEKILAREHTLAADMRDFLSSHDRPAIDYIAVTSGPGLEPALWVGINFARALGLAWNIPVIPVNHMEGHIFVSLFDGKQLRDTTFPLLALLISGGHTELILTEGWGSYTLLGSTRDDAVGEAFDKVARMLGLPYPGGPQISRLAEAARREGISPSLRLPRPMLTTEDYDFSFSGIKTAVLYGIKGKEMTEVLQKEVALEFENAVTEVLIRKTKRALDAYGARSFVLGGGVAANTHIRESLREMCAAEYPQCSCYLPDPKLTTDNAVMIAIAGHARIALGARGATTGIIAEGNKQLA